MTRPVAPKAHEDEPPIVQPPSSMTADFERRAVLWLPDGTALVRRIGYRTEG